ncbi:MAG: hypothetical protein IPH84_16835 [Bacteroidales bacterium]|nr:hypothetical protein [Bacteroidales bacterium]
MVVLTLGLADARALQEVTFVAYRARGQVLPSAEQQASAKPLPPNKHRPDRTPLVGDLYQWYYSCYGEQYQRVHLMFSV